MGKRGRKSKRRTANHCLYRSKNHHSGKRDGPDVNRPKYN